MRQYTESEVHDIVEAYATLKNRAESLADLFLESQGIRGGCNARTIDFSGGCLWFDDDSERCHSLDLSILWKPDTTVHIQAEVDRRRAQAAADAERARLQREKALEARDLAEWKRLNEKFGPPTKSGAA